jgi:hypothetical protein
MSVIDTSRSKPTFASATSSSAVTASDATAYTQQQVTDAIAASILHDGTYLGEPEGVFALLARLNLRQVN